ncbi:hypothetical protein D3C85_1046710 [compost metagenome]
MIRGYPGGIRQHIRFTRSNCSQIGSAGSRGLIQELLGSRLEAGNRIGRASTGIPFAFDIELDRIRGGIFNMHIERYPLLGCIRMDRPEAEAALHPVTVQGVIDLNNIGSVGPIAFKQGLGRVGGEHRGTFLLECNLVR